MASSSDRISGFYDDPGGAVGIGMVFILATPLSQSAMTLIPYIIAATFLMSVPLAWWIAPRFQLRYWRRRHTDGDIISR